MNKIKLNISVLNDGNYIERDIECRSISINKLEELLLVLGWEDSQIEEEVEECKKLLEEEN